MVYSSHDSAPSHWLWHLARPGPSLRAARRWDRGLLSCGPAAAPCSTALPPRCPAGPLPPPLPRALLMLMLPALSCTRTATPWPRYPAGLPPLLCALPLLPDLPLQLEQPGSLRCCFSSTTAWVPPTLLHQFWSSMNLLEPCFSVYNILLLLLQLF